MKGSTTKGGYKEGPPWIFKGRALYQLHLVPTKVARRLIPSDLHVVDFFGYTLGGLYFAEYDSSPAGKFDELVALAGIVWNPPTSCAWATRVYVDAKSARDHGRQEVGLPSRLAKFSKASLCTPKDRPRPLFRRIGGLLWPPWQQQQQHRSSSKGRGEGGGLTTATVVPGRTLVRVDDVDGPRKQQHPLCQIYLPPPHKGGAEEAWVGPQISMALPSFSGRTSQQPNLLKYACNLRTRLRIVTPARVDVSDRAMVDGSDKDLAVVLGSKPILALYFEKMEMRVEAPSAVAVKEGNSMKSNSGCDGKLHGVPALQSTNR